MSKLPHAESPEAIKAVSAARAKARRAALAKSRSKIGMLERELEKLPKRRKAKGNGHKLPSKAEAKAFLAAGKAEVEAQRKAALEIKPRGGKAISMREGTTQAKFYAALIRAEGASADELQKITGYKRGTLMSAIHGGRLKGKLKLMASKLNVSEDEKRGGKVYSIRAK